MFFCSSFMSNNIPDDFIASLLNTVDIDKLKESVQNGDINTNELQGLLLQILGANDSKKISEHIQQTVDKEKNNNDGVISENSINQILKDVSIDKIKQSVENNNIDVNKLQGLLLQILGEDGSKKILDQAKKIIDKDSEE